MRFGKATTSIVLALAAQQVSGFSVSKSAFGSGRTLSSSLKVAASVPVEDDTDLSTPLDLGLVSKLRFRELQNECEIRGLEAGGTVGILRKRLRDFSRDECEVDPFSGEEVGDCEPESEVRLRGHSYKLEFLFQAQTHLHQYSLRLKCKDSNM